MFDHLGQNSKTARDLDARRSSGEAEQQAVGRLQSLFVELDRSVDDAFVIRRVHLQAAVVRRGDNLRTAVAAEMVDDSNAECGTFLRIGAGAGLVEQDESRRRAAADHVRDVRHVRRKCRKVGRKRLVIANIGKDGSIERYLRRTGRNRQPRDRHQAQQTGSFEHDGFAAGVRARNDHHRLILRQRKRTRHDLGAVAPVGITCGSGWDFSDCDIPARCRRWYRPGCHRNVP